MSIKEKYSLTDEGVRNVKLGTIWTALTNIVVFMSVGMLFSVIASLIYQFTGSSALELNSSMSWIPFEAISQMPVWLCIVLVLVYGVVLFICERFQYYYQYGVIYKESGRQRIGLAERLRKLPLSFFGKRDLADLTETMMKDVQTCEHAYSHVLPELYGAYVTLVASFIMLLFYDWRLAIASMWTGPVALALLFGVRSKLLPLTRTVRMKSLAVSKDIQEALECVREVRATNQVEHYLKHIYQDIDDTEKATITGEVVMGICVNGAQMVLRFGFATTLLAGATFIAQGSCSFLVLFCFLLVVSRIYAPFDQALMLIAELFAAKTAAARMKSFYDEPLAEGSDTFEPSNHDIVFDDVSFSYTAGEQVLSHVSFTAKEGEVTALVGPSGSGKSTCSKLACRFWDVDSGSIRIGDCNIAEVDPEVLLRDFAVVFQDVVLFDDSVMENIRIGKYGATDEEVLAAARAANCDEFVTRMRDGYNTRIGENGARLSGGERQRISIARALLKNAPIVLLDEATASLDVENETQVQEALSHLLAGKTVVVIAHRMRTIENADKIVVLENGRIRETGTPSELLAQGGLFARMVALQKESADWTL